MFGTGSGERRPGLCVKPLSPPRPTSWDFMGRLNLLASEDGPLDPVERSVRKSLIRTAPDARRRRAPDRGVLGREDVDADGFDDLFLARNSIWPVGRESVKPGA